MTFIINMNTDKWNRLIEFIKQTLSYCDRIKLYRIIEEGVLLSASKKEEFISLVFIDNNVYNDCLGNDWKQEVKLCAVDNSDRSQCMIHIIKPISIGEITLEWL